VDRKRGGVGAERTKVFFQRGSDKDGILSLVILAIRDWLGRECDKYCKGL
jgi:hypothetical protein